jgi:membrane dipeptidase
LPWFQQSGITAVNCTVSDMTFEGTSAISPGWTRWWRNIPTRSHHSQAFGYRPCQAENKVGIIPGFQYTAFLEENPERIEVFRNLGVRIMQLTYNVRTAFGDGCLEPGNAGLSNAGVAAVKKMNEIGVAVDLSHSGYRTTSEAIAALLQAGADLALGVRRRLCASPQQARRHSQGPG